MIAVAMKLLTLMKLLSPSLSMGLLSAALVMAASTQATAQEYTFTTLAGPPELGAGTPTARAALRASARHAVRRWTARATCTWRTATTTRFGR